MINREQQKELFKETLSNYQRIIEHKISEKIKELGTKTKLRDACEYALLNGGKRLRPTIVLMVAKTMGSSNDVSEAAMAVEFFHTASLIADDLPIMDDDDTRRDKPSLHKVYGEALSLLASYGLIADGYACIAKNAQRIKDEKAGLHALENATYNTGLLGATGGQFLDICPPDLSEKTICEVIHKKTTSLFEIAFVLGWLFGGGSLQEIDRVKKAAFHFGLAFQLADDIDDYEKDRNKGKLVNYAVTFGKEAAIQLFHEEIQACEETLDQLNLNMDEWRGLISYLFVLGLVDEQQMTVEDAAIQRV